MQFTWKRYGGYEVSSRGDRRFSAFVARLTDGRTIEEHYQCDIKGYDPGGRNWRLGKGKPPLSTELRDQPAALFQAYLGLWLDWALIPENHALLYELMDLAISHDCVLSDRFATSPVNQAHALSVILTQLSSREGDKHHV